MGVCSHGTDDCPQEELGFRRVVKQMEDAMQIKEPSTCERIVWEEGLEAGIGNGVEKGRLEDRRKGREEGCLAAAREMLFEMIHVRFGHRSENVRTCNEGIRDEPRLWRFARAVLTTPSLTDLELL